MIGVEMLRGYLLTQFLVTVTLEMLMHAGVSYHYLITS